jgi:hypothetical protein
VLRCVVGTSHPSWHILSFDDALLPEPYGSGARFPDYCRQLHGNTLGSLSALSTCDKVCVAGTPAGVVQEVVVVLTAAVLSFVFCQCSCFWQTVAWWLCHFAAVLPLLCCVAGRSGGMVDGLVNILFFVGGGAV